VPWGRDQRQPPKDGAIEFNLPRQPGQIISIGLDLVPLEIVSDRSKIDPACAMSNAHLSNKARGRRVAPYFADKQISDGNRILEQAELELARCRLSRSDCAHRKESRRCPMAVCPERD
jgi:hypothetical protein